MSDSTRSASPKKNKPKFPLWEHTNGQWCKIVVATASARGDDGWKLRGGGLRSVHSCQMISRVAQRQGVRDVERVVLGGLQGAQPRRLILLVNPQAGRGPCAAHVEQAVACWKQAGIHTEVRSTSRTGQGYEIAHQGELENCDGLCVCGGDGTLREVVAGLVARRDDRRPPVGILPGGTGNSMLMHGGGDGWLRAVRAIAGGVTAPLDVVRVTLATETTYCANLIGWSSAAAISARAERWRLLGRTRYSLAAIWQIATARPEHLTLTCDGQRTSDHFLLVMACNTRYGGRRMLVAPQARIDDGQLDVLLVRRASRRQMLQLFSQIYDGSHVHLPFVEFRTVRQMTVEQDRPGSLTLDGELYTAQTAKIEVLPAALRLFV